VKEQTAKMNFVQFAAVVNLVQMGLIKAIHNMKNMIRESRECFEYIPVKGRSTSASKNGWQERLCLPPIWSSSWIASKCSAIAFHLPMKQS
jgi:hypothetical protein